MPFLSAVHSAKPLHILVGESLHTFLSASSHDLTVKSTEAGSLPLSERSKGGGHEPSLVSHTLLSSFKAAGLYWDNHMTDI